VTIDRVGPQGKALIKSFEGCKLQAYQDSVGVWTIGYGHTGPDVTPGKVISQGEADLFLDWDLQWVNKCIRESVKVPLNQNQWDALGSFIFNLGGTKFRKSTLLLKLNLKDYGGAADEFLKWDKAGGNVLPGLTRRRKAERELFLKGEQV
jgi:lysozyme